MSAIIFLRARYTLSANPGWSMSKSGSNLVIKWLHKSSSEMCLGYQGSETTHVNIQVCLSLRCHTLGYCWQGTFYGPMSRDNVHWRYRRTQAKRLQQNDQIDAGHHELNHYVELARWFVRDATLHPLHDSFKILNKSTFKYSTRISSNSFRTSIVFRILAKDVIPSLIEKMIVDSSVLDRKSVV